MNIQNNRTREIKTSVYQEEKYKLLQYQLPYIDTWWNTALLSCYLKLSITTDFFWFKTRSYYQYYLFNNGFLRKTLFSDLIQENKTSPILFESCEDMAHFLSFEERIPLPLQTI